MSNEVFHVSNRDHMPKLQSWEVDVRIDTNGAHSFGISSPRVRVLDI